MADLNTRFVALGNEYEADRNRAHLEEMFRLVDTDRDGFIVKGELVAMFQPGMGEEAELFASLILAMADKNDDDRLSPDEFISFLVKACEDDVAGRKQRIDELEDLYRADRNRAHLEEIFSIIDTNHDGLVTKTELVASMRNDLQAEAAEKIADFIIQRADKNSDRVLSVDEYVEFMAKNLVR